MDCPACGSSVTLEIGPDHPHTVRLIEALLAADEGEYIEVSRDCWHCGWHETRQIRVEAIERTDGDESAAERAAIVDEITDELAAINSLATLENALAEVRRQRRLEPSTGGTDRDNLE